MKPAWSILARALLSKIENNQMQPTKPIVIVNSAGEA